MLDGKVPQVLPQLTVSVLELLAGVAVGTYHPSVGGARSLHRESRRAIRIQVSRAGLGQAVSHLPGRYGFVGLTEPRLPELSALCRNPEGQAADETGCTSLDTRRQGERVCGLGMPMVVVKDKGQRATQSGTSRTWGVYRCRSTGMHMGARGAVWSTSKSQTVPMTIVELQPRVTGFHDTVTARFRHVTSGVSSVSCPTGGGGRTVRVAETIP